MSDLKLSPCPFCGGEAQYQPDHTTDGCDGIWCLPCDYGMFDPGERGSVVAAWNTRSSVITVQEAARFILDNLDEVWSAGASTAMDNARRKAGRDGHKYRVIDREGFRAALAQIGGEA